MKFLFSISLLVFLAGCATVGREITKDQIATFEKGKTTLSQVTIALGQPTTTTILQDGRQVIDYSFAHAQTRPETFIPFIGALVGGMDVRATHVRFTFDQHRILETFVHSETNTGSGYGLAGGQYQTPNRELPKETPNP